MNTTTKNEKSNANNAYTRVKKARDKAENALVVVEKLLVMKDERIAVLEADKQLADKQIEMLNFKNTALEGEKTALNDAVRKLQFELEEAQKKKGFLGFMRE